MTDAIFIPARSNRLAQLFGTEPLFAAAGLALAASLLVTLPAMGLDTRLFQGEGIWIKPIKFQIALMAYLLTLAFFAQWLPAGMTAKRSYRIYAGIVVFTIIGELAWISGAAMFGTASRCWMRLCLSSAGPVRSVICVFRISLPRTRCIFVLLRA